MKVLLKHGADVHMRDEKFMNYTALELAVLWGQKETMKELLTNTGVVPDFDKLIEIANNFSYNAPLLYGEMIDILKQFRLKETSFLKP
jgi:hypothetical protein